MVIHKARRQGEEERARGIGKGKDKRKGRRKQDQAYTETGGEDGRGSEDGRT